MIPFRLLADHPYREYLLKQATRKDVGPCELTVDLQGERCEGE